MAKAAASAKTKLKNALKIGDKMEDGTIYAGISPNTGKQMFAAPADAPRSMDFNAAAKYAKGLKVGGKKDFRVPTREELNVLFQNRHKGALKGTFNLTCSVTAGWYWSGTPHNGSGAYCRRFGDGDQLYNGRVNRASIRCVR